MSFSPDFLSAIQASLPELIGGLLVFYMLCFLGRDMSTKKNDYSYAAAGFLALVIKDIAKLLIYLVSLEWPISPPVYKGFVVGVAALQSIAFVLMIVGGLQALKMFKVVQKELAFIFSVGAIFMATWFSLNAQESMRQIIPTVYLTIGLVFLGVCFLSVRAEQKKYVISFVGMAILMLGLYYLLTITPFGLELGVLSWIAEAALYGVILVGLILTIMVQLSTRLDTLQKSEKSDKSKILILIQSSPFPIVLSSLKDDRLILANDKAVQLFCLDSQHLENVRMENYYVQPDVRKELLAQIAKKSVVDNFQAEFHTSDLTKTFWLEMSARVLDYDNEVVLYTAFKDVTEQKKHEEALFEAAITDPLTGLYNRRQFEEIAEKEIRRAWRYNSTFCLAMMDIDFFKHVNDTYGHHMGDEVLKALSDRCARVLRDTDVFARYGGEEFVLLFHSTALTDALVACERIRKEVAAMQIPVKNGQDIHVTISVGLVESSASNNLEELIKYADVALYQSKEKGRNQITVYGKNAPQNEAKK